MPDLTSSKAFCNISAIKITVVVVPSLAERSCELEDAISKFAVGCSTLAVSKTVTPSLVTLTLPS